MKTKGIILGCACLMATLMSAQDHHFADDSLRLSIDTLLLNELVVTAQKPLIKVDVDKITYDVAEDPEASTNNLLEMLKKVPMVTVDSDENVQLKGSSNIRFYMNGKPSNLIASNPKDVLRSIPANTIKNIEVITEPGAKYDAEGVNGIINIITQNQSALGGYTVSLSAGGNSHGGYNTGSYFSLKYGKIGFTGNFNYYNIQSPQREVNSFREDLLSRTLLTQQGQMKNYGSGIYGYGELSYEIDTFNLLNVSLSKYGGDFTSGGNQLVQMRNSENLLQYQYNRISQSTQEYGSSSFGIDYQRSFDLKDRLLTVSYMLEMDPNDSRSDNQIINPIHFAENHNRQYSNASTKEHTFQVDYTTPFAEIHSFGTGAKYIRRSNESDSRKFLWNENDWLPLPSVNDEFRHVQDILAFYADYGLKYRKWGFKTGLRYETLWLNAAFPADKTADFDRHYSNLVPSVTATYLLKPGQVLKAGYNMRIQRPGIWYLNPYVNTSDTSHIRIGNPNLNPVMYHILNLNYNLYTPKFNLNANLSYNFANNGIDEWTWIENNVAITTYNNIARSKMLSLSTYLNWNPTSKFRIYGNLSGNYVNLTANNATQLQNSGFAGNFYGGVQYTIPWNIRLGLNNYCATPRITLQGKSVSYYDWDVSASKSFLKDRLNLRLYADNPFFQYTRMTSRQSVPGSFIYETNMYQSRQRFGIHISYRFGEMKAQIKKTQRGINNDDNMSGGSQNSGSSGSQQSP